jgi:flagellar export protein FliJ
MFHFRMQSVLDVRERITRLKQKEFSEVLARHQALEARIVQNDRELARAARNLDTTARALPNTFSFQLYGRFRQRLLSENDLLREQIREQAQELESRRTALVEARRAQRTLEILRDKERARNEHDLSRRERFTMDEIASNYHLFRQPL